MRGAGDAAAVVEAEGLEAAMREADVRETDARIEDTRGVEEDLDLDARDDDEGLMLGMKEARSVYAC